MNGRNVRYGTERTSYLHVWMSAIGPKRTSLVAPHMSAFGGKADMALCGNSLLRSLLGVKRTCPFALHMSANDPKRTSPYETFLPLRPNLLCLISVVPRPSNGMVACTGEIS
jgi:hypothetical protein